MFELNEEFLKEVGIATMPEPARSSLVANIQKLMQNRLNLKLADQLSDEKVDELEHVSTSTDDARKWLGENYPKFESSAEYEQFKQQVNEGEDPISLFAQSKWFQTNVPNFSTYLNETYEDVKNELKTIGTGVPA